MIPKIHKKKGASGNGKKKKSRSEKRKQKQQQQQCRQRGQGIAEYCSQPKTEAGQERCVHIEVGNMSPLFGEQSVFKTPEEIAAFNHSVAGAEIGDLASTARDKKGRPTEDVLHLSYSWDAARGDNPTNEQMVSFTKESLEAIGFDLSNTKYAIFVHRDKENPHTHVEISRVDFDKKRNNMGLLQEDGTRDYRSKLAMQKAACELAYKYGYADMPNCQFQIRDGKAVFVGKQRKKSLAGDLSDGAKREEERTGKKSPERVLRLRLAAAMPALAVGMGRDAFAAELAQNGITATFHQGGIVYGLTDAEGFTCKASTIGGEASANAMKRFYTASTEGAEKATPANLRTLFEKEVSALNGAKWQVLHESLKTHGIEMSRLGGTGPDGELVFALADGQKIQGSDIGISLQDTEKMVGTRFRNARTTKAAQGEKSTTEVKNASTTTGTTSTETKAEAATKAQVEKTDAAYAQGRDLKERFQKEEREYFENARIARDVANRLKQQGYNRKDIENALKKFGEITKGVQTPEKMAIAAILVLLKSLSTMRNDLSGLGSKASGAIAKVNAEIAAWRKEKADLERQAARLDSIRPAQKEAIYRAFHADTVQAGQANPFLISGGIATRLRLAGHDQTSIVEILKAGGEDAHLAETSGFYAFSEKGNQKFAEQQRNAGRYERMEHNARSSAPEIVRNKTRNAQSAADNAAMDSNKRREMHIEEQHQQEDNNNNTQNTRRKSHGMKM